MKAHPTQSSEQLSLSTLSTTAWLFPAVALLVVLVSTVTVLLPQAGRLMDERKEADSKQLQLERLETKRAYLEGLSADELVSQLAVAERALPSGKPLYEFLSSIYGLTEQLEGMEIVEYNLSPGTIASESAEEETAKTKEKPGVLANLPIQIVFEGSLEMILELVDRLEAMAPLADMQGFALREDLNVDQVVTEDSLRSIETTLHLYYSLRPEELEDLGAPVKQLSEDDLELLVRLEALDTYEGLSENFGVLFEQTRDDVFVF